MSSTHQQPRPNNRYAVGITMPAILYTLLFTLPSTLAGGYTFNSERLSTPTSEIASKVLFHSPSLANIYKEMIVSSKPLNLRKYSNGSKVKKTKKDSKIYYIPIPPMPYRYIPGVGFDYQPMKIKPILQEESSLPSSSLNGLNELTQMSAGSSEKATATINQQTTLNQKTQNNWHSPVDYVSINYAIPNKKKIEIAANAPIDVAGGESKLYSMDRGNYYFNGRPFRLQVAHAQPKNLLTPLNLKSKLYFNKKIIY
ncbi:uncharacterized protein LOC105214336 [Zeugodacus cucurbitae]|uniref:Tetracycline resistance protein tetQ n=1 Tax=Zeugodacus cucurbitae TaxID=28588 RepID=A0A0A1WIQ2_ZEUCU|nr:uncharacterized protein LOC105214336 [Zeugodacus cucurbitae]